MTIYPERPPADQQCLGDVLRDKAERNGLIGSGAPATQEGIFFERWIDRPSVRLRAQRQHAARLAHARFVAKMTGRTGRREKANVRPRVQAMKGGPRY